MDASLQDVWRDFEECKQASGEVRKYTSPFLHTGVCTQCSTDEYSRVVNGELTCTRCGLVLSKEYSDISFDVVQQYPSIQSSVIGQSTVCRLQHWYNYTNEEKNAYKLFGYIQSICTRLDLPESVVDIVRENVQLVMSQVKQTYGTKRAKVKDSIIAVCVACVVADLGIQLTQQDIAKVLCVTARYISKAETMMIELYNAGKLPRNYANGQFKNPFEYVLFLVKKHKLAGIDNVLKYCKSTINYCEANDILSGQSPMTLGVVCFYYSFKKLGYTIDIKTFASVCALSHVTLLKCMQTLEKYSSNNTIICVT